MNSALFRKTILVFVGLFVCFEVVVTLRNFSVHLGDLQVYYDLSQNIIVYGLVPYHDFKLEYPPLAILTMLFPQLLCQIGETGFYGFIVFFALQNIVLGFYTGRIACKIANTFLEAPKVQEIHLIYWILWVISLPIFLFRYDAFVAFSTILVIYYVVKQSPVASGVWLAVGILAKLYPVIFVAPIVFYYFVNKQYRFLALFLGGVSVISVLTIVAMYFWAGEDVGSFLKYHQLRGIQLESLVGGWLVLWNKIGGTPLQTIANFGAIHLVTPLTISLLKVLSWGFAIAYLLVLGVIYAFFQKQNRVSTEMLLIAFGVVLLLFLVSNKVFSPQYLIWFLPIVPFLRPTIIYCFGVAFILTIAIYPGSYHRMVEMKLLWVVMLNVRNGLIFVMLMFGLYSMPFLNRFDINLKRKNIWESSKRIL